MCTEIEAKLKVDSLSEVEHKLGELGARFLCEQLQTDYFFDDVNAALIHADKCLRLRRQIVGKSESCFLTYKGAKEKSILKRRQEIESEIYDADSIYKLLQALATAEGQKDWNILNGLGLIEDSKENPEDFDHQACFEKLKEFQKKRLVDQYICGVCVNVCKEDN